MLFKKCECRFICISQDISCVHWMSWHGRRACRNQYKISEEGIFIDIVKVISLTMEYLTRRETGWEIPTDCNSSFTNWTHGSAVEEAAAVVCTRLRLLGSDFSFRPPGTSPIQGHFTEKSFYGPIRIQSTSSTTCRGRTGGTSQTVLNNRLYSFIFKHRLLYVPQTKNRLLKKGTRLIASIVLFWKGGVRLSKKKNLNCRQWKNLSCYWSE